MMSTPQMPAIRNTILANLMATSECPRGTDEQKKKRWRDSRSKPGRKIAKLAATRTKLAGLPGRKRRDAKSAEARRLQNQESEALEDAGGAHAAADAHGDHAITRIAALQFADDGDGEFCAGAAEGMAESDGPGGGIGDKTREGFQAQRFGAGVRHHHGCGGAIAHLRTVSRGDRTFHMKRGLELGQHVERSVRPRTFIGCEDKSLRGRLGRGFLFC